MALRLYTNHNVFGPIVKGLRRRDVDVLTAYEDGAHELDDRALLFRVVRLDRILFSQDEGPENELSEGGAKDGSP